MRCARSGASVPPRPFKLWHCTHCSVWNSCSPRLASPGTIFAASALHATSAPAAITRSRNIAGLLFVDPEPGHESVHPEGFVLVEIFPETVVSPLGVPLYVLVQRQR